MVYNNVVNIVLVQNSALLLYGAFERHFLALQNFKIANNHQRCKKEWGEVTMVGLEGFWKMYCIINHTSDVWGIKQLESHKFD